MGPVHQCAHIGDAGSMLTGPSRGTSTTNAKMTASVVGYHAPGMGDGATEGTRQGGGEQEGNKWETWEPDKRAELRCSNTTGAHDHRRWTAVAHS